MFRLNIFSFFFLLQIYISVFLFAPVILEEISDVTESTFENNGESLLPEDHREEEEVPNTRQGKAAEPVPAPPLGCTEQDHRSCDDVCKGDSFWYGYCGSWDGRDFQCTCLAYKEPLNGTVCGPERQENCASECREKGQEAGGYCAVFPSAEDTRGEPKCMCFEKPALN